MRGGEKGGLNKIEDGSPAGLAGWLAGWLARRFSPTINLDCYYWPSQEQGEKDAGAMGAWGGGGGSRGVDKGSWVGLGG